MDLSLDHVFSENLKKTHTGVSKQQMEARQQHAIEPELIEAGVNFSFCDNTSRLVAMIAVAMWIEPLCFQST